MRPMKILRETSSSCSSRARNSGSSNGGGAAGSGMDGSGVGIDGQLEAGQQARLVLLAEFDRLDAPALAVASVDDERRGGGSFADVEDPVFLDRGNGEVDIHVADRVLLGIVRIEYLD